MKIVILMMFLLLSYVGAAPVKKQSCTLEQKGDISVVAEGYKTDFRAGVSILFKTFEDLEFSKGSNNIAELLMDSSVVIDSKTLESSKPLIQYNLLNFFFKNLVDGKISAKVVEVKADNNFKGVLTLEIKMNGVTKSSKMRYYTKKHSIYANGEIELLDFKANKALEIFSNVCSKEHLGKTWSEVGVSFEIPTQRVCK